MYTFQNNRIGGESGKVHSTVRERWANQDPTLVSGMTELGSYADEAMNAIVASDYCKLVLLMNKNFAMRRKLYGDEVVGTKNIKVVELAKSLGFAAKFTGSGGAILCLRSDGINEW